MHSRKNFLMLAVSGLVAAGLPCRAQSSPRPVASAPTGASSSSSTLMDHQAALKLVKNWGPITTTLSVEYAKAATALTSNESGVTVTFEDGTIYHCIYKDTPNPVVTHKFLQKLKRVILNCSDGPLTVWNSEAELKNFAAAWTSLAAWTPADSPEKAAAFEAIVEKYHADPETHILPEEARAYKVQAEMAVSEKRFADAADRFAMALEISPWWAPGHYNLALIYGELKQPDMAIVEMKKYLKLEPQAPNARAAQDQIYKWSDKLQR